MSGPAAGATAAAPVLEIRDLVTAFGRRMRVARAVDGVSLRIASGESVGLVGESGCGKTITALSVLRLLPPAGYIVSGEIIVNGRDVLRLSEREMCRVRGGEVAMVFQDPMTALTPTMPIGRQVAEAVRAHRRIDDRAARDRVVEVLSLVGLPRPGERLGDYPHMLSGGQRQRVAIAMALASEPRLLIADEPTTAVDVTVQAQILRLLDDLRHRLGMAVLLITHDMGVIAGRTDRVAVMYAGRVVEEASTEALFARTHHPYTEALLASIPRAGQTADVPLYTIPGLPPDITTRIAGCRFAPRCRYSADDCRSDDPALGGAAEAGHRYACHHPVGVGAERGAGARTRS